MAESPLPPAEKPSESPLPDEQPGDLTSGVALESPAPPPACSTPPESLPVETRPLCRFFLKGRCHFGARCQNPHPNDTGISHNLEDPKPSSQDSPPHHPSGKKPAMKTAEDVISRLLWDSQVPAECFSIGYLDRFLGTLEKPFIAFSWEDLASAGPEELAIPKHRIQYFKYREHVVWDKASRTDDVFGSTGSGRTILQVIEEEEAAAEAIREKAHSHAADEEGGKGGGTRQIGEEVDNADSAKDAGRGFSIAAGGQEMIKDLEEAMDNVNCAECAILDGSEVTSEAGGKVVRSGTAGHRMEEAELSKHVLGIKKGTDPMMAEDEENKVSASKDRRYFPGHKQRPTHFVAVRISSSEIREAVRHFQTALCKVRPDLAPFCVPLATLHVTLCLLRLDSAEEIHRAIAALRELQANSQRLLAPASVLSFQGVGTFHSHVLYMCPASDVELETVARSLEDAFCRKQLTVVDPPGKRKLHLTVVKIPPGKQGPQLPAADPSWIPPIDDLGSQAIETICLCEAGQGRVTDGFYTTLLKLDLY